MCGIAGLLANRDFERPDIARLKAMLAASIHRGPDDWGTHVDDTVMLGVRRLSIIDLAGGHQPIANEDGNVWVAYNGECYNYRALRRELEVDGHQFATATDTEIIVHGYEQWGIRGLAARLNGIFAFCVWDARARKAYLVRDRLGVKPLYYVSRASGLAFASEIRSLIQSGLCLPKLNEQAVWQYLLYQFAPGDETVLDGVRRLAPAQILAWNADNGTLDEQRYWDLEADASRGIKIEEAADTVKSLLTDSVRLQMTADVPIGCFLSGGLDSSSTAALMARYSPDHVRTFSIAFPNSPEYDESAHAEFVARSLKTRHTAVPFDERVFARRIGDYLAAIDEPVADAAMMPTFVLAETAANDVKVVLSGEGADELFGGYHYYRSFVSGRSSDDHHRAPEEIEHLRRILNHTGIEYPPPSPDRLRSRSGFPYVLRPEFIWCMLHPDRRPPLEKFRTLLECAEEQQFKKGDLSWSPLQRAMYTDIKLWLANDVLMKLDKASMAQSLEARVPFLDHRLVEFAFGLPDEFKIGAGKEKLVLHRAMQGLVPNRVLQRRKQGFGVPLNQWWRGALRSFVGDRLQDSALVEDGILTAQSLECLHFGNSELGIPLARALWAVICLDAWWRDTRRAIREASDQPQAIASKPEDVTVDIIIPVHEGLHLVRDCLRSIQAHTKPHFRVIVVDDCSCDATHTRLKDIVNEDERFELLRNSENLGFLETCNRGIQRSSAKYIVLLNSDTIVAPNWLDRLVACAESDPQIAFVNPITNESGNTSVRFAPGLNVLTMAKRIAKESRCDYPGLTTGVGMCALLRRSALDLLGGFDAIYGHGYCEESDLCMRFTEAGFRVVAADDAFIYHKSLGSHESDTKDTRYAQNRQIFDQRWSMPYERDWANYARNDPLQYLRHRLLRGTVTPSEMQEGILDVIDQQFGALDTARSLQSIAGGARSRAALSALPLRTQAGGKSAALAEFAKTRLRTPPVRFDTRTVAYPTKSYVAGLPSPREQKLRITFLISELVVCGGVNSILQLTREMLLQGHDVKYVMLSEHIVPEELNLWLQPLIYRDLDHMVEAFPQSEVVVATFWPTAHLYLRALRAKHSFASVYFVQDYEAWFYPEIDYRNRRDVVRSYETADHHIVKSKWLAEMLAKHGVKCNIVHAGLDLGIFYPREVKRSNRPRVLAVAAKSHYRGLPEAIDTFRQVHENRPDIEFVFFGASPEAMPKMPFPYTTEGFLPDPQKVATLLSSVDIVLDASHWQGFGRPGLEAMACGATAVLTNVGGLHEYARHEQNCLLVPPHDTAAAAAAILRLLGDDELLSRLRASGPATAARFCHRVEAERHLALYTQWVDEKAATFGRQSA